MNSNLLEDFKALRAEELALMARRTSVQNIGTVLFSGLLTAAVLKSSAELSLAGTLLMLAFWRDDIRWCEAIAKIGSYIREVIEPQLPGLRWQTTLLELDETHKDTPSFRDHLRLFLSRYSATVAIGLLTSTILIWANQTGMKRALSALMLIGLAILSYRTYVGINASQFHRKWGARFRAVREKMEPQQGPGTRR